MHLLWNIILLCCAHTALALESNQKGYTVPTLVTLCTEMLSIHAPEVLTDFCETLAVPVLHLLLPTFEEQVGLCSHAATTIERFSPHGIRDMAISSDGHQYGDPQRIIALDLNNRICARKTDISHAPNTVSTVQYTLGALVSPSCDTIINGPLTNACEHKLFATPIQSKPIDCVTSIEKLLAYTTLSGPYFIHTKSERLCKIDDIGFNALIKVPTQNNALAYGWQLICRTPEVAHSYKTSAGGSICMYLTRVATSNDGEKLTDNARIIDLDAYFDDSKATGVYVEHNDEHGPLCCFALSSDGNYVGMGYRGKCHTYKVSELLKGERNPHVLTHAYSNNAIQDIAWPSENPHIITIDEHGTISFHTPDHSTALVSIRPRAQCPFTTALTNAATHLAIGYGDGSIYIMPLLNAQSLPMVQRVLFARVYNFAKTHLLLDGVKDTLALLPKHIQKIIAAWHTNVLIPAIRTARDIAKRFNEAFGDMNIEQLVTNK